MRGTTVAALFKLSAGSVGAAAIALALSACGPSPKTLEATPKTVTLNKAEATSQLKLVGKDEAGTEIPDVKAMFSSSDPAIATVDGHGMVTAKKSGKATITAKAGEASVDIPVTVMVYASIKPAATALAVKQGATVPASAQIMNEAGQPVPGRVMWTSSDAAVATVDAAGNVMGVAPGKATLTGKAEHLTTTISVEVKPRNVTALAVAADAMEMAMGAAEKLTAQAVDDDGSKYPVAVTWTSSDAKVVSVTPAGEAKALKAGKAKLTAKHEASGKTIAVTVTVKRKAA